MEDTPPPATPPGGIPRPFTVSEAAEILRMDVRTVRKLCRDGEIQSTQLGRHLRIPAAEMARLTGDEQVPA